MASAPTSSKQQANAAAQPPEGQDVFRDSVLRYVAFTSDLGEALKPFISRRAYVGSYAVVALYGLLDTADKGQRAYVRATALHQPTAAMSAIAAASLSTPQPTTVPAAATGAPARLPLAALPTAAALRQSASNAASACAACLPPAAVYASAATAAASSYSEPQSVAVPVAAAVLDTALWHSVASLALPAALINRTVWAAGKLLARFPRLPLRVRQLAPSAAGLALLPLAVHHIDEGMTRWMDAHLRPHLPQAARTTDSHTR